MLAKKNRLPANTKIHQTQVILLQQLTLRIGVNSVNQNRVRIIVSKKIAKSAVKRNRIRRKLRSFFEVNYSRIVSGHDFLITLKAEIRETKFKNVFKQLEEELKKTKILK